MNIKEIFNKTDLDGYLISIQEIVHQAKKSTESSDRIAQLEKAHDIFQKNYNAWYNYHAEYERTENEDINALIGIIEARDYSRSTLVSIIKEINTDAEDLINSQRIRAFEELIDNIKE